LDVEAELRQVDEEFEQKCSEELAETVPQLAPATEAINPLYCTACKKLFAKDTVFQGHLKGGKHQKAVEAQTSIRDKYKEFHAAQFRLQKLCSKLLMETIENTKTNIVKKQARTWKELQEEMEIEEKQEDSDSEEEPEIKMTIDNYPVGWDGKPIPYWLYKLHGLGVEYKCEICGNASYWGRKAYERHFQEWRHAHGMRCLGIPNSKHFHDITKINDSLALWEKIKRDNVDVGWRPEAEEEYEDKEGNVFNKKVFEDLKRQGLL